MSLFAPQLDLHNHISEIGKNAVEVPTHAQIGHESLLIAVTEINALFWILCRLNTLASAMTSTTFMYSFIHVWTLRMGDMALKLISPYFKVFLRL